MSTLEDALEALQGLEGFPSNAGEVEGQITPKGARFIDRCTATIREYLEAQQGVIAPGLRIRQKPGEDNLIVTRMNRAPECAPHEFSTYCVRGSGPTCERMYVWLQDRKLEVNEHVFPAHFLSFESPIDRRAFEVEFQPYIRDYPSTEHLIAAMGLT